MSETVDAAETTADDVEATRQGDPVELADDHPLVRTLAAQKSEIKELKAKARRLDEIEDAQKSQTQLLTDRLTAETDRADKAETALLRYEVAVDKGVPVNALKFLTGSTRDEIEQSAKDVLGLIGEAGKPRPPKPDPNQGVQAGEAATPAGQFASFLKQQLNNM